MISLALVCDAIIGNVQEKAMKAHKAPNSEVVFFSYGIGFIYLLVIMTGSGHLLKGIKFCSHVRIAINLPLKFLSNSLSFAARLGHLRPWLPVQPLWLLRHSNCPDTGEDLWGYPGSNCDYCA